MTHIQPSQSHSVQGTSGTASSSKNLTQKHLKEAQQIGVGKHGKEILSHPLTLTLAGVVALPLGLAALTTGIAASASALNGDQDSAKQLAEHAKESAKAFKQVQEFITDNID